MAARNEWQQLHHRMVQRFHKGVVQYGLLQDGDKILIGLSGGKDSLALLEFLSAQAKIFKPKISVMAAHVSMQNIGYQADVDYLQSFATAHGVPFIHHITQFDASTDSRKSPCFLCSWNRRKALFTIAQREGCNKIALGHHMDDILETLLMNLTFQGAFSTMPPRLDMRKFHLTIIRPLCLVHEADLLAYAQHQAYKQQLKNCPYEQQSHRNKVKHLLKELETLNPDARYSLWGSMDNIQTDLLPHKL